MVNMGAEGPGGVFLVWKQVSLFSLPTEDVAEATWRSRWTPRVA